MQLERLLIWQETLSQRRRIRNGETVSVKHSITTSRWILNRTSVPLEQKGSILNGDLVPELRPGMPHQLLDYRVVWDCMWRNCQGQSTSGPWRGSEMYLIVGDRSLWDDGKVWKFPARYIPAEKELGFYSSGHTRFWRGLPYGGFLKGTFAEGLCDKTSFSNTRWSLETT